MSRQRAKCGDASLATAKLKNRSVQLVIFSPPYGLKRKRHYPGIPKHELAEWLLSFARVVKPKLKPNGAMAVIIEPGVTNGQAGIYGNQAIVALQHDGWTLRRNY